jgi:hypothetical protein
MILGTIRARGGSVKTKMSEYCPDFKGFPKWKTPLSSRNTIYSCESAVRHNPARRRSYAKPALQTKIASGRARRYTAHLWNLMR